jgi:hypothetical protein
LWGLVVCGCVQRGSQRGKSLAPHKAQKEDMSFVRSKNFARCV